MAPESITASNFVLLIITGIENPICFKEEDARETQPNAVDGKLEKSLNVGGEGSRGGVSVAAKPWEEVD